MLAFNSNRKSNVKLWRNLQKKIVLTKFVIERGLATKPPASPVLETGGELAVNCQPTYRRGAVENREKPYSNNRSTHFSLKKLINFRISENAKNVEKM